MKIFLSFLVLVSLVGCASKKAQNEVHAKAATETSKDGKGLVTTINDLINNSSTLSDAQKQELTQIMKVNKDTADSLTEESFKFRSVLVKELLSGNVDKKKVNILKKDIKRIEEQKLKNTFDTVEKITKIVSGQPDNQKYVEHIINIGDRTGK